MVVISLARAVEIKNAFRDFLNKSNIEWKELTIGRKPGSYLLLLFTENTIQPAIPKEFETLPVIVDLWVKEESEILNKELI